MSSKVSGALSALGRNLAANSLMTGLITAYQVVSVPVFLHFWGVNLYGEWIALNTLTAYFQITDVGLNTATANSLTFAYSARDYKRCNVLLNNNIIFIIAAFTAVFLVLIALIAFGTFTELFRFRTITPRATDLCLLLLFAQVFLGTLTNLLTGIYRATGVFARGVMLDNAIRACEYIALLSGVALRFPLPLVVSLGVGVKILGLAAKLLDSHRFFKFTLSSRYFRLAELRQMWVPAVSFFFFPVSNSIALQAPVTLINFFLGGAAVVVFNTTRTLINFSRSLVDILQRSVWPELSLAYGNRDFALLRRLHRHSALSAAAMVLLMTTCLTLYGPRVYTLWTRHAVHLNLTLFHLFLVSLVTTTVWSTSGIVLQATNKHNRFSALYFASALVCLGGSFIVLRATNSVTLLPLAVVASDLIMIAYVLRQALALTHDSISDIRAAYSELLRTKMTARIGF